MGINDLPNTNDTYVYNEATKVGSNISNFPRRILVYGEVSSAVSANIEINKVKQIIQKSDINVYGNGSHLYAMLQNVWASNQGVEIWACPLTSAAGSAVSTATIVVTGNVISAGTQAFYINGERVPVSIPTGSTIEKIVLAINTAIASNPNLAVDAVADDANEGTVILKSKWAGLSANEITLSQNILEADKKGLPTGLTFTTTKFVGGLGTPTLDDSFPNWGKNWFTMVCLPYTDKTSIDTLTTQANQYWDGRVGRPFQFVSGFNGVQVDYLALVSPLNNKYLIIGWVENSLTPSYLIASSFSIFIENSHNLESTIAYYGTIPGILAGDDVFRKADTLDFIVSQGGCLVVVNSDSTVKVQKIVTTYKKDAGGEPDNTYQMPQTTAKIQLCDFELKATFNSIPFIKAVLVADGTNPSGTQRAVSPNQGIASASWLVNDWANRAIINYPAETLKTIQAFIADRPTDLIIKLTIFFTSPLEGKGIELSYTVQNLG